VTLEAGYYARFELERRFLLERLPDGLDGGSLIVDHYVTDTRLRLRRVEGGPEPQYKFSQKEVPSPPDYATMKITTLYLSRQEYDTLSVLPGKELRKRRYPLAPYSIDLFEDVLSGLILAEITFGSDAEMRAHPIPDFAVRDVSDDVRYTGGALAANGLPK
jgi:hypothetical protein